VPLTTLDDSRRIGPRRSENPRVGGSIPPLAIRSYSVLNASPVVTINTSNRWSIAARLVPGAYQLAPAAT